MAIRHLWAQHSILDQNLGLFINVPCIVQGAQYSNATYNAQLSYVENKKTGMNVNHP